MDNVINFIRFIEVLLIHFIFLYNFTLHYVGENFSRYRNNDNKTIQF